MNEHIEIQRVLCKSCLNVFSPKKLVRITPPGCPGSEYNLAPVDYLECPFCQSRLGTIRAEDFGLKVQPFFYDRSCSLLDE